MVEEKEMIITDYKDAVSYALTGGDFVITTKAGLRVEGSIFDLRSPIDDDCRGVGYIDVKERNGWIEAVYADDFLEMTTL